MPEYVTIRRWSLKEGATEAALLALVKEGIIPAYRNQPGCQRLQLLRIGEPPSYLAVTYWEDHAAFERWAGPDNQAWRDSYRSTLERWLDLMTFEQEWDAEQLLDAGP
jgi:heme-degrading monooxygenase HmoA